MIFTFFFLEKLLRIKEVKPAEIFLIKKQKSPRKLLLLIIKQPKKPLLIKKASF